MRLSAFTLLLTSILLMPTRVCGQQSASLAVTVTGSVSDTADSPLPYVHIISDSLAIHTTSSENGSFSFTTDALLPFCFELRSLGFKTRKVCIGDNTVFPLAITLEKDAYLIDQVDVEGHGPTEINNQQLDISHIRTIPSAAGHSIESLVRSQIGVTSSSELSSQYRVRGGNFDENMVTVNGVEVYRPFLIHSGQQEGLSFVNPDLVESVEFSAGGFSASYGDKMSSVLDINYKRPKEHAGSISAGMLGASLHLEGTGRDGKLSWIGGARYKTNRYLLGTLEEKGYYHPNFTDIQTFISYQSSPALSFDVLGYYSSNRYRFQPQSRETTFGTISDIKRLRVYFLGREEDSFETGYAAVSANYSRGLSQYKLTTSGFRTYEEETYDIISEYWMHELEDPFGDGTEGEQIAVGGFHRYARNDLFGTVNAINLEGKHRGNSLTSWGLQYRHEQFRDRITEWERIDSADYSIPQHDDRLELAYSIHGRNTLSNHRLSAFIKKVFTWQLAKGRLNLDAGIRATWLSFNDETTISPRILLSYLPEGRSSRYRLSGGVYNQSPMFREMRRQDSSINEEISSQRSIHLVAGYDYHFAIAERPFKFTTELYYKYLDRLIPYHIDNVRIVYSGENEAQGYTTGVDFKINGELVPGEESWATLSIMKSEEDISGDTWDDPARAGSPGFIPRPSDQRVNFSLFLQDKLPHNPEFKAHLSFFYGSGLPFGPPRTDRYKATYRMPPYRRVDIGFSYDLLSRRNANKQQHNSYMKNLWLGIEVFNLPDINNTISYYWVTDVYNRQYAVPNYLTSRRINIKLTGKF